MAGLAEISPCRWQCVCFMGLLLWAAMVDGKRRVIPDVLNLGIVFTAGICFKVENLWGMAAAIPFLVAAIAGRMGGGDVKFVAACGLVLGPTGVLLGSILGLCLLLCVHAGRCLASPKGICVSKTAYPLAPYLAAGFAFAYVFL